MVAEQVGQRPARADGETRGRGEIVFRDNRVLHFVVIANVDSSNPVDGGLDLLSIRLLWHYP